MDKEMLQSSKENRRYEIHIAYHISIQKIGFVKKSV